MKKTLITTILLLSVSILSAQNYSSTIKFNWEKGGNVNEECSYPKTKTSIRVTPSSCVPSFLSYRTYIKKEPFSDTCKAYYYIEITNNSKFRVHINFRWNVVRGGANYILPGRTEKFETFLGTNSKNVEFIFEKIEFSFSENQKKNLGYNSTYKVACGESDAIIERKLLALKNKKEADKNISSNNNIENSKKIINSSNTNNSRYNSSNKNSSSKNNNSRNTSSSNSSTSNNSSNTETEAQKQARKDKERGEQIMRETSDKITEVKQSSSEIVKAVTPLVSGIAKGIADKSIKSIRLMYGTRSFNGESEDGVIYSEVLFSDSYELGLSFGKGGFSLGGAFGDGAFAGIVGLYYDAFPGLVSIEDNSFISIGFGAEVGFGFSDQEASETSYSYSPGSSESLTYYSPGIYVLFFKDILYFSYNYGWTSGEETLFYRTDTTTKSLKGTYNKIGFGINIKF